MNNSLQPMNKIRNTVENLQKSNLFSSLFNMFDISNLTGNSEPKINVSETKSKLIVTAELPGVSENNIDIDISNEGYLTISGDKTSETAGVSKKGYFSEISYGHISRTIPLPNNLDYSNAKADYQDGVLTISVPKLALDQKNSKKIAVKKKEKTSRPKAKAKTKEKMTEDKA